MPGTYDASNEPTDEAEVEGHMKKFGANDEPEADEADDEVEAHGIGYDEKTAGSFDGSYD